jgi:hypothetical protein
MHSQNKYPTIHHTEDVSMKKQRHQWLVDELNALAKKIQDRSNFMKDEELRAAYVVVHTATAALMFDEAQSLAQTCADWCGEKAFESEQLN